MLNFPKPQPQTKTPIPILKSHIPKPNTENVPFIPTFLFVPCAIITCAIFTCESFICASFICAICTRHAFSYMSYCIDQLTCHILSSSVTYSAHLSHAQLTCHILSSSVTYSTHMSHILFHS